MEFVYPIIFVFCMATSFLLSGMEAGLFALSRLRIRQRNRKGDPRAAVLLGFLKNTENFLWTILVGNTVSNLILVSLGVIAIHNWLMAWPWLFGLVLVVGAILFYTLCELLPKMLFRLYPNRLCLALATPFRTLHLFFRPLVSAMNLVSLGLGGRRFTGRLFGNRDEFRQIMQESSQNLTNEERLMVNRVLDLQNLKVHHITIPFSNVVGLSAEATVETALTQLRQHLYSRLPVWTENPDGKTRRTAGLVSIHRILYREPPLAHDAKVSSIIQKAHYLDGDMPLEEALRQMQRYSQRLAIVVGDDGRDIGIICLQDILKAIFGEVSL